MNWRSAGRIVTQLLLVAPMFMMFPFALLMACMAVVMLAEEGLAAGQPLALFCQLLSAGGLVFLFLSIGLPTRNLRGTRWRAAITVGLVAGLLATAAWLGTLMSEPEGFAPPLLNVWTIYLFGGAVVVAVWNLWRAWRRESVTSQPEHDVSIEPQ